jgi:peptidoglycan hydrolase-like protein with peptidoglycan-binding domain
MEDSVKKLFVLSAVLLLSISVMAQDPAPQENAPEWRITENEVYAVQAELSRRGYYRGKPTGVLDRDTRAAVRNYQSKNALKVTGRIDRETYETFELPYPATGEEGDSARRRGVLPTIGYGVKDAAVTTGKAVGSAAVFVKNKTVAGAEKTKDVTTGIFSRSKDTAGDVGKATVRGARSVGRGTSRANDTLVGRSDADIHLDIREILEANEETTNWYSDVKEGRVTVKTPPEHNEDTGELISAIRKVSGVKSVLVIAE